MSIPTKPCIACGRTITRRPNHSNQDWDRRKFCSHECRYRGPKAVARVISGERKLQKRRPHEPGYWMLFCPWHPSSSNGWVFEHRILAERRAGRLLRRDEHVHHINEDPLDNRLENLEVLSPREHHRRHSGITDEQIAGMLRLGLSQRQIERAGAGSHRIVEIRRLVRAGAS